jgi:hypothetical protein
MTKITKQCKIDVISHFFAKKNQRMTNLSKAPASKLDELIAKYNIDFDAELKSFCDHAEKKAEEWQRRQDANDALMKKREEEWERRTEEYLVKWNNLCKEYKTNIITQKTQEIRDSNERAIAENERFKQKLANQFGVSFNNNNEAVVIPGFIFSSQVSTTSENVDIKECIHWYDKFRDQIDYYNDLQEPKCPPPEPDDELEPEELSSLKQIAPELCDDILLKIYNKSISIHQRLVCPHCNRNEEQCQSNAENVTNPITTWCGWGLSCDDCYYNAHPEDDDY